MVGLNEQHVIFVWSKAGKVVGAENFNTQQVYPNSSLHDSFIFTVGKPKHLILFDDTLSALNYFERYPMMKDSVFIVNNPVSEQSIIQKVKAYCQNFEIDSIQNLYQIKSKHQKLTATLQEVLKETKHLYNIDNRGTFKRQLLHAVKEKQLGIIL